MTFNPSVAAPVALGSRLRVLALLLVTAMWVSACSKSSDAATQVAAKVNKEEISVHQVNFVLQRQPNLKPEQAESASQQILEKLIDQELAVQKAIDQKIDRDPQVVQAVEAARREILARAYVDRVALSISKPTDEDIRKYYDERPALFKERRIYTFLEIIARTSPEQATELQSFMKTAKTMRTVLDWLKERNIPYKDARSTTPAESLPLNLLDQFAAMQPSQAMVLPEKDVVRFIILESAASEPKTLEQARGAIELFLVNERKRKMVESDLKTLREGSKIAYMSKTIQKPAEPDAAAASAPAASASAAEQGAIGRGLSGLK